ncbi:MAG: hypothetical protein ACHQIG_00685 [Acidimicrobiia bacterium]
MPDDKQAHDRALDLFVYAPVGVALYVRDMLPTMMTVFVSRGKREVQSHLPGQPPAAPTPAAPNPVDVRRRLEESLGLARVVTESGLGVARGVAGSGLGFARGLADTAVQGLGAMQGTRGGPVVDDVAPAPSRPAEPPEPSTAPPTASPAAGDATPTPAAAEPETAEHEAREPEAAGPAPSVESLAIPDYDELSASQVVERLEGLDATSLDAIRRYESAHRGRNTILGKIARLT